MAHYYQMDTVGDDLQYILVTGIANQQTRKVLDEIVEEAARSPTYQSGTILCVTQENSKYYELLGTRIGRVVGGTVLYSDGSGGHDNSLSINMRFDVRQYCPQTPETP
ncbi:hypothetical protein N7493_011841 [Penicillium malachiteum]|uniref:Uncharacterized protein n=1 Tax=Penicillium malachiteum TaxID=1324776 RepID=A0AAD6HAN5_9EURO|nr:hypothetical protein N7493_011841 [Penicillium malachiteum]